MMVCHSIDGIWSLMNYVTFSVPSFFLWSDEPNEGNGSHSGYCLPSTPLFILSCLVITARTGLSHIEKKLPQRIMPLQKLFLSLSHTGIPEEGKLELAFSGSIIISAFPSQCPQGHFIAQGFHDQKGRGVQRIHPHWPHSQEILHGIVDVDVAVHRVPTATTAERHWAGGW